MAVIKTRQRFDDFAGPVRTCLGCGQKFLKEELLRFGVDPRGFVEADPQKKLTGRGVYCCPQAHCLTLFVKKKERARKALRVNKVYCGLVERLIRNYQSPTAPLVG